MPICHTLKPLRHVLVRTAAEPARTGREPSLTSLLRPLRTPDRAALPLDGGVAERLKATVC